MWVTFQLEGSDKTKKFQMPATDVSMTRKDQEGTWRRIDALEEPKRKLAGFAILRQDPETNMAVWTTFDGQGKDFKKYPVAQPLLFPADLKRLPVGTRVELHLPEDE